MAAEKHPPGFGVRRHIDFVYSTALRILRDSSMAEDVTQRVFVALGRNASKLQDRATLIGWLHDTARNFAVTTIRSEEWRRRREQEAAINPISLLAHRWLPDCPERVVECSDVAKRVGTAFFVDFGERNLSLNYPSLFGKSLARDVVHFGSDALLNLLKFIPRFSFDIA